MVVEMDAVIIDAVRTPVGKLRGVLSAARPDDLGAYVIEQLLKRNPDVSPGAVEEVFFGCANQAGRESGSGARGALLLAGLPEHVRGVPVNRLCASGLEAAVQAARAIRLGDMELCIAGGVESMTRAPWALMKPGEGFSSGSLQSYDTALGWRFPNPRMQQRFPLESMGETAENVAAKYRIAREKQDEFALRSHQRALAAREAGRYRAELLPVIVPGKQPMTVDGGAIALGHPLGMSGARILGHLAHALKARGGKYGLATLCVGVGQGVSVIVESV